MRKLGSIHARDAPRDSRASGRPRGESGSGRFSNSPGQPSTGCPSSPSRSGVSDSRHEGLLIESAWVAPRSQGLVPCHFPNPVSGSNRECPSVRRKQVSMSPEEAMAVQHGPRPAKVFGSGLRAVQIPNLMELQINAYSQFLQRDVHWADRDNIGLESILREIFPINSRLRCRLFLPKVICHQ